MVGRMFFHEPTSVFKAGKVYRDIYDKEDCIRVLERTKDTLTFQFVGHEDQTPRTKSILRTQRYGGREEMVRFFDCAYVSCLEVTE